MKSLHLPIIDALRDRGDRIVEIYGSVGDETCGVFDLSSIIDGGNLRIIASSGAGWDHVSVSRTNRCPNWPEMEQVKRLFFNADEVAMQLHVAESDHVSVHPYCLHIWRPTEGAQIPLPPVLMVA